MTDPGWGTTPVSPPSAPPQPAAGVRLLRVTRPLDGLLIGIAAAAICGVLWWAVVALTERQFVYGAVLIGFLVGQGVLVGARRGGPVPALIAFAATFVSLTIAEYFIQRSLAISQFGADLHLWLGWSVARELIETTVTDEPVTLLFWVIAAVVAAFVAGSGREPVV